MLRTLHCTSLLRAGAAGLTAAALLAAASDARAESGVFNLHIDLGAAAPVLGELGPSGTSSVLTGGGVGQLSLDWQVRAPIALELTAGGGYFLAGFPGSGQSGTGYFNVALGARARFLDNHEGYANEPHGDYLGNAWLAAHVGYHLFDGSQLGFDLGGGYQWSVARPLQIGLFVRGAFLPDFNSGRQHDALLVGGVSFSFELGGRPQVLDTDGDTLSDEREVHRWHTNPNNPDTDGDGLNDGLEARTHTSPNDPDTDRDGLGDGVEDANRNGVVDARESDPRVADTDHGGVSDGWEAAHPPHNLRDPADDDSDGDRVLDDRDECPNTPLGTEVDARGCAVLRAELVLEGINFAYNSADILPDSEQALQRAAQILRDNPNVRVEISGHTDNVGTHGFNVRLSQARAQAVRDWLVSHGIPAERMTVRGYGEARPRASNDTEEGRAQNRRIEFHRLDQAPADASRPNTR